MKPNLLIISIFFIITSFSTDTAAKIPEPDNLIYGTAHINGVPITESNTIISITASVDGKTIATYKMGSNPGAKNYYDLSLALDYRNPRLPNTVRTGETGIIYIAGFEAQSFIVGERGEIINLNINANNAPDTDNDTIPDLLEDKNNDGNFANDDTDGDGMPDYMDDNDDGDTRLTKLEDYNNNGHPTDDDINNNNIPDYLDEDFPMDYPLPNISCFNIPQSISNTKFAIFNICNENFTHYKFKTNLNTVYSDEYSTDMPIHITATTDGIYAISIIGKDTTGIWQSVYEPTNYSWTVYNLDLDNDATINLKDAIIGIQLLTGSNNTEQIRLGKLIRILKYLSETK
ncbi:secreted protein [Candidatus Magnetomorum sp. HK-1]|nr:secreted protein [Candidatus Magnetomorum sp. HK-1]